MSRRRIGWLIAAGAAVGAACAGSSASDDLAATTPPKSTVAEPSTTSTTSTTTTSTTTTSTSTTTTTTTTATTTEPDGPTGLAWRTIEVVDSTRATLEVVGFDGAVKLAAAPTRTVPTVIVYEGVDGGGENAEAANVAPKPLIVWANGLGGMAAPGDPLLLALVEAGYVVAAPNNPELSAPVGSASGLAELPADMSAVIDALVDDADGTGDDLAQQIDPERIGVAGHSIGATGVLGTAFHDCCRDERVDAAVGFGVNPTFGFDGGEFRFVDTPLLLIHGSSDDIAPLRGAEETLETATGPAFLLTLDGGDHFEPVYGDADSTMAIDARAVVAEFLDVHVGGSKTPDDLGALASSIETGSWTSATT